MARLESSDSGTAHSQRDGVATAGPPLLIPQEALTSQRRIRCTHKSNPHRGM